MREEKRRQTVLEQGLVELAWTSLLYEAIPRVRETTEGGTGMRCNEGWYWSTTAKPQILISVGGRTVVEALCEVELFMGRTPWLASALWIEAACIGCMT